MSLKFLNLQALLLKGIDALYAFVSFFSLFLMKRSQIDNFWDLINFCFNFAILVFHSILFYSSYSVCILILLLFFKLLL